MNTIRLVFREAHRNLQSIPSKEDTFATGTKYPSKSNVRLIESQIKGVKKGRDQVYLSVLPKCSSYWGVVYREINRPCINTVRKRRSKCSVSVTSYQIAVCPCISCAFISLRSFKNCLRNCRHLEMADIRQHSLKQIFLKAQPYCIIVNGGNQKSWKRWLGN